MLHLLQLFVHFLQKKGGQKKETNINRTREKYSTGPIRINNESEISYKK